MSRLCRIKTKTHGEDGQWAYEEITKLREQVEYHKAYAEEAMSEFNWLMETKKEQAAVIEKLREALSIAMVGGDYLPTELQQLKKTLTIPTDSTQILDEVRRAERERVISAIENAWFSNQCNHEFIDLKEAIRAME